LGGGRIFLVTTVMLKDQKSSFIAEEADGLGDKGSEINISVDVETKIVVFLVYFPHSWIIPQMEKYQEFLRMSIQIQKFYCKWRLQNEQHNQTSI
jgi:hypothetical protein